jgi:hypothetical protein
MYATFPPPSLASSLLLMIGNIETRSPLRFADLLLFVSTTLTPSLSGDLR